MGRVELCRSDDKFFLRIVLEAGRAGQVEFTSTYPTTMSRSEAEARLFRISELYNLNREDFPTTDM